MKYILLNREDFKSLVFKRDSNRCVVCGEDAVDAHHLIDRSLWSDGGYYLDNGVSLCAEHHIDAESTIISCQELRNYAKIDNVLYPEILGLNEFVVDYDKWGNPVLKSGKRLKGYWFNMENVRKMLKFGNVLHLFEKDFDMIVDKYPRSYHTRNSPGTTNDDRISKNINMLCVNKIVMTEKLDGSNLSISRHGIYGRSRTAPSQNKWDMWIKPYYDMIKNDLGDLEICGENMFGIHSIEYPELDSYFYVFGIRDTVRDMWLSWEEVEFYSNMLDLKTVPVLYKSDDNFKVDESWIYNKIEELMLTPSTYGTSTPKEGIVTRLFSEFPNDMFYNSLAKYVRKGHVQTDIHWTRNWKQAQIKR